MSNATTNTTTTNTTKSKANESAASSLLKLIKGLNTLTTSGVDNPQKLRKEFLTSLRDDDSLSTVDKELLLLEFNEQQEILTGLLDQSKEVGCAIEPKPTSDKWWVQSAKEKLRQKRAVECASYEPPCSCTRLHECGNPSCDGVNVAVINGKGVCQHMADEFYDVYRNGC